MKLNKLNQVLIEQSMKDLEKYDEAKRVISNLTDRLKETTKVVEDLSSVKEGQGENTIVKSTRTRKKKES